MVSLITCASSLSLCPRQDASLSNTWETFGFPNPSSNGELPFPDPLPFASRHRTHLALLTVPSAGIEPTSQVPETCVLSIERRGRKFLKTIFKRPLSSRFAFRAARYALHVFCGPEETRTPHLYNANVALYQMSYGPASLFMLWAYLDSNQRPLQCECSALTN